MSCEHVDDESFERLNEDERREEADMRGRVFITVSGTLTMILEA